MTGRDIYDLALDILGCKNSDGSDNPDCADYASRAPTLLSLLLAENLYLDRLLGNERQVPAAPVSSLDGELDCHELLGRAVLPYGLASLLVCDEDAGLSRLLYKRYLANIDNIRETAAAVFRRISDCYKYHG